MPVPSFVKELAIVGLIVVAQQTPLAVTEAPPSVDILPPDIAVVFAIFVTEVVLLTVGTTIGLFKVVNEISFPYPVPALFVA